VIPVAEFKACLKAFSLKIEDKVSDFIDVTHSLSCKCLGLEKVREITKQQSLLSVTN
jgi:hypothetical protein